MLGLGVLTLLFVAYQLWGTGIYTKLHQDQLRHEFNRELALARHRAKRSASVVSTPTTTPPFDGVAQPVPGDVPPNGAPIGTIDIPSIGADYVVVEGVDAADLALGPGHYPGTPLPGQPGNAAIAGHRTTYLAPFFNLDQLKAGDPIYVTTTQGRFEYVVHDSEVVSPSDTSVLDQTSIPELTLTTCNPRYSAAQRLVVQAIMQIPTGGTTATGTPSPKEPAVKRSNTNSHSTREAVTMPSSGNATWESVWWGAVCLVVAVATWSLVRRRFRSALRWVLVALGISGFLVVLFFFFGAVSQLLPPGY
jgi:sortase A